MGFVMPQTAQVRSVIITEIVRTKVYLPDEDPYLHTPKTAVSVNITSILMLKNGVYE